MATLEAVYCKFGEAAEAAQLLETELGTLLFALNALDEKLFEANDPDRAGEILDEVNRHTLGQLLKRLGKASSFRASLEIQLAAALNERNRLSHTFYRQHNLRRNSADGRDIILRDLGQIHDVLLDAYKAVMLLTGTDLDAMVAASRGTQSQSLDMPTHHLPI